MSYKRIIFEHPVGWTDKNSDPLASQHLDCLATIRAAANELNICFQVNTCPRLADFAQRFTTNDTLLISVHTIGVAKNVVRLKESYLPGLYYFDRTGYSGWAELAYNADLQKKAMVYDPYNASEFIKKIRDDKIRLNSSKYSQPDFGNGIKLNTDGKPYILLALQTSDDLVARLSAIDQLILAESLAETLRDLNMFLVIKRHPRCCDYNVESTIMRLQKKYKGVLISSGSINSLILGAKAVVTANSGVGFEALVMGVPLITAGRSDYSFVTHNVSKIEDLACLHEKLNVIDGPGIASMIKYYCEEYCITCGDIQKAIKFLRRWESEEYSCMSNMYGYVDNVLKDIQNYVVQLEKLRRDNCITTRKLKIYERYFNCIRDFK